MKNHIRNLICIVLILLLPAIVAASLNNTSLNKTPIQSDLQIVLKTKYLYLDSFENAHRIQVNISTNLKEGTIKYVEEYYVIDSYGNPRSVSLGPLDCKPTCVLANKSAISFEILRAKKPNAGGYSLIKATLVVNGAERYETWLNSSGTYKFGEFNTDRSKNSTAPVKNVRIVESRDMALPAPNEQIQIETPRLSGNWGLTTLFILAVIYTVKTKKLKLKR
jgi:hypothetical protein